MKKFCVPPGIIEENVIYSLDFDISALINDSSNDYNLGSESGILTVIAVAKDSSGNSVSSELLNLTYTKGSIGPEASLSFGGNLMITLGHIEIFNSSTSL